MSLLDDTVRVAMSDLYYMRRNAWVLIATSLVTPLLYFVAFGLGLGGAGVEMEGYGYVAFMIPGVVALTTLTSSFTTIANKLMIQKRFYESFDELMLCPISKSSIILGKAVLGVVKGSLCGLLLTVLGHFLSGDMQISVWLILMVILSTFVFSMLGVAAGMIVKDLPRMNAFNSFVILPMTFLCGTMFSLRAMPDAVRYVIEALPLTHATECIRALALGTEFPWPSLLAMVLFGVAFYLIAQYALRRSNRSPLLRLTALLHRGFRGLDPHLNEAVPGLLAAFGRRFRVHLLGGF